MYEPLKEELDKIQRQQIIGPLGVDETSKLCNSFTLVPKVNSKVRLCQDQARLNKVLIRPTHRGPTLNDILPIDVGSDYHNLKLYFEQSFKI